MASMNEKDYYAVLEVDEGATTEEIRRAFQKKARKLHPNRRERKIPAKSGNSGPPG